MRLDSKRVYGRPRHPKNWSMFSANQTITRALAKELRNSPVKIWIYMLKKVIYKYNIAQPNVIGCSPIRVPRFRDGFNPRIVAEADKTEIVNNENDGNSDGKFLLQTDFFDKTCCPVMNC
ncbi:hypothetical protein LUQ84_002875 [Hamiltosporidium tvaerminnensis]|nr:hypothetical protein LUQ84_002875 [Hamiltosporidium tvaerminnensis]